MPASVTRTLSAAEVVADYFREALELVRPDFPRWRVLTLPEVTPAGLDTVAAVVGARPDLSVFVGRIIRTAADFPAVSRRRRVLGGLAKWLPGMPLSYLFRREVWFDIRTVRGLAEGSAGACTDAEAAGYLSLMILAPRIEANLRG